MSDLFEEEDSEVAELEENFEDVEVEIEEKNIPGNFLDARRRLESMLDEKRLQDELQDFLDF